MSVFFPFLKKAQKAFTDKKDVFVYFPAQIIKSFKAKGAKYITFATSETNKDKTTFYEQYHHGRRQEGFFKQGGGVHSYNSLGIRVCFAFVH